MIRMEIIYDPTNHAEPLKLTCPSQVNPAMVIMLLSQLITALAQHFVAGNGAQLVIPAANLPKMKA